MVFSEIIQQKLAVSPGVNPSHDIEPLAHLDYGQELALKSLALAEFWNSNRLPGTPTGIVPSPKPRHYRTTTKRHALSKKGELHLSFFPEHHAQSKRVLEPSLLEPVEHTALYDFVNTKLSSPLFGMLNAYLNYVIIRGSYTERCVIFNVHQLGRSIVKKLMLLAEHVSGFDPQVRSSFIFFDPDRSRYYLDTAQSPGSIKTKNIFGPDKLFVNFNGNKYQYYPTMFSQVNESMVPAMLSNARDLLAPEKAEHLIDLYCGYGLFTHFLASSYAHACGIEAETQNIKAAKLNARFYAPTNTVSFFVQSIGKDPFTKFLPSADCHPEVLLTDPPRQGMPQPVIAALAAREPIKVLQACCGTDEIPRQITAWRNAGYAVKKIVPLDMFAGTPHLETLILFVPA